MSILEDLREVEETSELLIELRHFIVEGLKDLARACCMPYAVSPEGVPVLRSSTTNNGYRLYGDTTAWSG
jgi:hypothetical protein